MNSHIADKNQNSNSNQSDVDSAGQLRVGIIGAGIAGLVTAKVLLSNGFEKNFTTYFSNHRTGSTLRKHNLYSMIFNLTDSVRYDLTRIAVSVTTIPTGCYSASVADQ